MMDLPEKILKKAVIFLAVYLVLQFFVWADIVLQSALVLLALGVTNIIVIASYHLMPKLLLPKLNEKAVLITGCDSGFGHELAQKLDKLGVMVFAACLFPEGDGASKLKECCSQKLQILKMDVTKDDDVEAAASMVSSTLQNRSEKLWAIVNNAGIGMGGEVDWSLMESYYTVLEVNTFGPVRVTKAFLPLLKKSKEGRVVVVTSILGHVSYTGLSGYCMSKYAAVSFADTLRQELLKWSISVHKIEPWLYRTNILSEKAADKTIDDNWLKAPESVRKTYGDEYIESYRSLAYKIMATARPSSTIHDVVDDMLHAVVGKNPKITYVPGVIGQLWTSLTTTTPTEISDYISYVLSPKLTPNT